MKIEHKKLLSNQELKSELLKQQAELKNLSEKVSKHVTNRRLYLMLGGLALIQLTGVALLLQMVFGIIQ